MTAGTAIASDVIWQPPVPTFLGPVSPVLQLADGSFVGSGGFSPTMIAFDAAGNTRWVAPGYNPQMATADGGIIGQASTVCGANGCTPATGVIVDANGNATDQLPTVPTYSWKGAYEVGSVESVAIPAPTLLATFAGTAGGNLSGNGTALVQHSFGLFWCGTDYGEQGSCAQDPFNIGGADINFSYMHDTDSNPADLQSFSAAHPDWVDTIQNTTLSALQKAFQDFPVTVVRATAHQRYSLRCLPHLQCVLPDQEHTVYVVGDWTNSGTGLTINQFASRVYYAVGMQKAQDALKSSPNYPPVTQQDNDAFKKLLPAIGAGIGNAGAHELGHQLAFSVILIMDCNEPGANRPCAGGDTNVFEYYAGQPWQYLHVYPQIHWQQPDNMCAIHQYFEEAYRNKKETCNSNFTK